MTKTPGWHYYYSKTLELEYAVRVIAPATHPNAPALDHGKCELYTEDKVHYSPSELDKIKKPGADGAPGEITKELHRIKKLFSCGGDFARILSTP